MEVDGEYGESMSLEDEEIQMNPFVKVLLEEFKKRNAEGDLLLSVEAIYALYQLVLGEYGDPLVLAEYVTTAMHGDRYCSAQLEFIAQFLHQFSEQLIQHEALIHWLVGTLIADLIHPSLLNVREKLGDSLSKILNESLHDDLAISTMLGILKAVSELEDCGRLASDVEGGVVQLFPDLDSVGFRFELPDRQETIELTSISLTFFNDVECHTIQAAVTDLLEKCVPLLSKIPTRSLLLMFPDILGQLRTGSYVLQTSSFRLISHLLGVRMCDGLFGLHVIDHVVGVLKHFAENQPHPASSASVVNELDRCLQTCTAVLSQIVDLDPDQCKEEAFLYLNRDHLVNFLHSLYDLLHPDYRFGTIPVQLQCSTFKLFTCIARGSMEFSDNEEETDVVTDLLMDLLRRIVIERPKLQATHAATANLIGSLIETCLDYEGLEFDAKEFIFELANLNDDDRAPFDDPETLLQELESAFLLINGLSVVEDSNLLHEVVSGLLDDNGLYRALSSMSNRQRIRPTLEALVKLAALLVDLDVVNALPSRGEFTVDTSQFFWILSLPWIGLMDSMEMDFQRDKTAQAISKWVNETKLDDYYVIHLRCLSLGPLMLAKAKGQTPWRKAVLSTALCSSATELCECALECVSLFLCATGQTFKGGMDFIRKTVFPIYIVNAPDQLTRKLIDCIGNSICACHEKPAVSLRREESLAVSTSCNICVKNSQPLQQAKIYATFFDIMENEIRHHAIISDARKIALLDLVCKVVRHCSDPGGNHEPRFVELILSTLNTFICDPSSDVRLALCRCFATIATVSLDEGFSAQIQNSLVKLGAEETNTNLSWALCYLEAILKNSKNSCLFNTCLVKLVLLISTRPVEPTVDLMREAAISMWNVAKSQKQTVNELYISQIDNICYHLTRELCDMICTTEASPSRAPTPAVAVPERVNETLLRAAALLGYRTDTGMVDLNAYLEDSKEYLVPWLFVHGTCSKNQLNFAASSVNHEIARMLGTNRHSMLATGLFPYVLLKATVSSHVKETDDETRVLQFAVQEGRSRSNVDHDWAIEEYFKWNSYQCVKLLLRNMSVSEKRVLSMVTRMYMMDIEKNPRFLTTEPTPQTDQNALMERFLTTNNRFLGILLDMRQVLEDCAVPLVEKRNTVQSLTLLIHSLRRSIITNFRTKVLIVLRAATANSQLKEECAQAWSVFANSLEIEHLSQLLPRIVASVLDLTKCDYLQSFLKQIFFEDAQRLRACQGETSKERWQNLMQVLNGLPDARPLETYVARLELTGEQELNACLTMLRQKPVELKTLALRKLNWLLHDQPSGDFLQPLMDEDNLNPLIVDLMLSLIDTVPGCADDFVRTTAMRCLGAVGAIDPGRMGLELSAPTQPGRVPQDRRAPTDVFAEFGDGDQCNPKFVVLMIEKMVHFWICATTPEHHDMCSVGIQNVLKQLRYKLEDIEREGTPTCQMWRALPEDVRMQIIPMFNTSFVSKSDRSSYDKMERPLISNERIEFGQWLTVWVISIAKMLGPSFASRLFNATFCLVECDPSFARFLLPHVLIAAGTEGNNDAIFEASKEMAAVLGCCANDSIEWKHLAAQTIFSTMDVLNRWLVDNGDSPGAPSITMLLEIEKPLQREAASSCHSFARALMILEGENKPSNELFPELQQLYFELNEPDGVAGALVHIQNMRPAKQGEQILACEAVGNYSDALPFHYKIVQERGAEAKPQLQLMKCHLKLNQAIVAMNQADKLKSSDAACNSQVQSVRVEALRKLQDWTSLERLLRTNPHASGTWQGTVGELLLCVHKKQDLLEHKVKCARRSLVEPLVATTLETGSYELAYGVISKLHLLTDIERVARRFEGDERRSLRENDVLLRNWQRRNKLVQQSSVTLEPLLDAQRQALSLCTRNSKGARNYTYKCWLLSSKLARNAHHLQTAFNFLANVEPDIAKDGPASESIARKYAMEKAKILWDRNQQQEAISTLTLSLGDKFDIQNMGNDGTLTYDEMAVIIRTKIQLATYLEATDREPIEDLLLSYNDCKDFAKKHEDTMNFEHLYYKAAVFADKNILNRDFEARRKDFQTIKLLITYYGTGLTYGSYNLHHSMPRLLTLWLDYGTQRYEADFKKTVQLESRVEPATPESQAMTPVMDLEGSSPPIDVQMMNEVVDDLFNKLPKYQFYWAFSQLASRMDHPSMTVFTQLKKMLVHLMREYPHQCLWLTIAIRRTRLESWKDRCRKVYNDVRQTSKEMYKMMEEFEQLSYLLHHVAMDSKECPSSHRTYDMSQSYPELFHFFEPTTKRPKPTVMIPLQSLFDISLPQHTNLESTQRQNQTPAPDPFRTCRSIQMEGFGKSIKVMESMQKPKLVVVKGSDGCDYRLLFKNIDDLRLDKRMMEFDKVVNTCLRQDPEARRRQLHVRMYSVVPMGERGGFMEFVPNLTTYRAALIPLFEEKMGPNDSRFWKLKQYLETHTLEERLEKFDRKASPVMGEWFRRTFTEPCGWYAARLAFTRTAAVMSMVGFVIGLGDRHTENILIDTTCGDCVHVDFNLLFNKGEVLSWPEVVPFRLTNNMVDGFGPLGIEGPFRRACQVTLRVLRERRQMMVSVLDTVVHDPHVDLASGKSQQDLAAVQVAQPVANQGPLAVPIGGANRADKTRIIMTGRAQQILRNLDSRLRGQVEAAKMLRKSTKMPVNVEGQVDQLFRKATDPNNLCKMFPGWASFI